MERKDRIDKKATTIWLPKKLHKQIKIVCAYKKITMMGMIQDAVSKHLEELINE